MEKNELLQDGLLDENEIENMLINPLFTPSPSHDIAGTGDALDVNVRGTGTGGSIDDGDVEDIINPSIDPYVTTPKKDDSPNNKVVSVIRKNYNGNKIPDDGFRNQFHDLFDEYNTNIGDGNKSTGTDLNSNDANLDNDNDNQELYSSHLLRGALASPQHQQQRLMSYNQGSGNNNHSTQIQQHDSNTSNNNTSSNNSTTTSTNNNRRFQNKTRPAFVNKVWSMINDPANSHLIQWADDGLSLIVTHREQFVHEILPKYFKHSNFASFVRQLNMYGWHKVQDVKSGSIQSSSDDRWQFENEYFIRGREDLLNNIVRQKGTSTNQQQNAGTAGAGAGAAGTGNINFNNGSQLRSLPNLTGTTLRLMNEASMGNTMDVTAILGELEQIKFNQIALSKDLMRINKDNELLWKENMMARERYRTQQQALEKIFKFLRTVVPHADQKLLMDASAVANSGNDTAVGSPGVGYDSHRFDSDLGSLFDVDSTQDDMTTATNRHRARYLLKNRAMSSSSNKSGSSHNKHNDSSGRISEIPFEDDDDVEKKSNKSSPSSSSDNDESIEEINGITQFNDLKANLHEQEARIKHLEELVETTQQPSASVHAPEVSKTPLNNNNNNHNVATPQQVMTPLDIPHFDISDYLTQAQTPSEEENPPKRRKI